MRLIRFRKVAGRTRLYVAEDFVDPAELRHLLERGRSANRSCDERDSEKHDATGYSFEMAVAGDAVLTAVRARLRAACGFDYAGGETMRYRRYRPCEAHPLHSDTYEAAGSFLVATALLWLSDTEEGGETLFPFAVPAPLLLQPRRGRMGVWLNYRPDGTVDRSAMHEALPVIRGEKITLTAFLYAPIDAVPAFARDLRDEPDIPGVQVADFARQPG